MYCERSLLAAFAILVSFFPFLSFSAPTNSSQTPIPQTSTSRRPFGYFYPHSYEHGYHPHQYDPYSAATFMQPQYQQQQYMQYPMYVKSCRINYLYCVPYNPTWYPGGNSVRPQQPYYPNYYPTSPVYGYQYPCNPHQSGQHHVHGQSGPGGGGWRYGYPGQSGHGHHHGGHQSGPGSYSSSIRYPCGYYPPTFQITYNPKPSQENQEPVFLGRGHVERFQGRDAELTCTFNDPSFRVVSNAAWVKINGPYDHRTPYPSFECHDPCSYSYVNAMEDFRYRVITMGSTSILRIYEVQPKDFGIYRCTATGERTDGGIRTLYQIVEFTS